MNILSLTIAISGQETGDYFVTSAQCTDGIGQVAHLVVEVSVVNPGKRYELSDFEDFRGKSAALTAVDTAGVRRSYSGVIERLDALLSDAGAVTGLRLTLEGWPREGSSYRKGYRFFQDKTAVEVATEIFQKGANRVDADQVRTAPPARVYQVQYDESDADFTARTLLGEQLLFQVHPTEAAGSGPNPAFSAVLRIFDQLSDLPMASESVQVSQVVGADPGNRSGIFDVEVVHPQAPDLVALAAFKTSAPNVDLRVSTPVADAQWIEVQTHTLHDDAAKGQARVDRHLRARRAPRYRFGSEILGMAAGQIYPVTGLKPGAALTSLAVVSARQSFRRINALNAWAVEGTFEALQPNEVFEPTAPAKPVLPGLLRGIVVAKEAGLQPGYATLANDDKVDTDEFGRIRVRILWHGQAREAELAATDVPWLRLMTPWAGKSAGFIALPRAGQEVVVSFVNGDAALPLVMGCVYGDGPDNSSQPWPMESDPKWVGLGTRSAGALNQFIRLDASVPAVNSGVEIYSASRTRLEAAQTAELSAPAISIGSSTGRVGANGKEAYGQNVGGILTKEVNITAEKFNSGMTVKTETASLDKATKTPIARSETGMTLRARGLQFETDGFVAGLVGMRTRAMGFQGALVGFDTELIGVSMKGQLIKKSITGQEIKAKIVKARGNDAKVKSEGSSSENSGAEVNGKAAKGTSGLNQASAGGQDTSANSHKIIQ